uniref:KIB1-4 beta-propeller domain-containing protein n=1 Tax=Leersia perrieri TaxID=77586 RepID=A0A0D9WLU8_9ORYZ
MGYMISVFLVGCGGKLLIVKRYISSMVPHDKTAGFEVFEADLTNRPGRWRRVNNLGGQALFVGKCCSKAFPAGEAGGAQEDCIYFMCDYPQPKFAADPLRDSGVYNMRNGMITPLLTGTTAAPTHRAGQSRPTWLFPTKMKQKGKPPKSSPSLRGEVPIHDGLLAAGDVSLAGERRETKRAESFTLPLDRSTAAGKSISVDKLIMASTLQSSSWADLQPELLGLVLRRLPSLADRVRLRAVCRPWHSNARMQSLPPPLPWLALLDGTFLSIPNGEIHYMHVPDDACCHGSIDNWLFLMQSDGECSLLNPFSKATLNLPKLATYLHHEQNNAAYRFEPVFYKLVAPSTPDSSPDSLIAALIMDEGNLTTVFICQPPVATDSSRTWEPLEHLADFEPLEHLADFVFLDGKLYAIAMFGDLVILEISGSSGKKANISGINFLINSRDHHRDLPKSLRKDKVYTIREYLVECSGRLLMVRQYIDLMAHATVHNWFGHDKTAGFMVFEADLSSRPGRWRMLSNLGGQALFVGKHCSKAFPAREAGGAQEDCIYFMCDYPQPKFSVDPLLDSGVYNMRNGMITDCSSTSTLCWPEPSDLIMASELQSSSWADLQPELLGLILKRLPSLADRVRLRAICRPWCSNARLQSLPPPLPWLSLIDGTFLSITSGEIHRLPVPDGACCHGSIRNWLFLVQSDGRCLLMNPFSKATLNIPMLAIFWLNKQLNPGFGLEPLCYKLAVTSLLDSSPDCLVAVLITDDGYNSTVFLWQPPVATDPSRSREPLKHISDFTFFDGKLYALSLFGDLVTLEISGILERKPNISSLQYVIDSCDHIDNATVPLPKDIAYVVSEYLVECGGRLLKVKRYKHSKFHWPGQSFFERDKTAGFEVFEADFSSRPGQWRRVNNLGGQALFVGKHCSKAFPAGEAGGAQEDCIYFMRDYSAPKFVEDPLRDSGVYNMRNGMITSLLTGTAALLQPPVGQSRIMASKLQSSSWADLYPELLALVLGRLPSHADRVRLRAAC